MGDPVRQSNGLNPDEVLLWKEFIGNSTAAYDAIYNQFVDELYRYSFMILRDKSLAEDVIHDVFTDIWCNRKNLGNVRSVRLYLFSCIKRRSFKKLKKEKRLAYFDPVEQDHSTLEIVPSFLDELIHIQDKKIFTRKIKKAISGLSKRQREIIYLRFYQGMSYSEIAELLQLDQKYIYNMASKAFVALRKVIPPSLVFACLATFYFLLF